MYIVKNAWKSITRSKARNILIGLIVLVIATSSCVALSIRQAANKAKESGLEALEITARISIDRQALMQNAKEKDEDIKEALQGGEELSLEEMQTYAQSSYVKDFYYSLTSSMSAAEGGIDPVSTQGSEEDTESTSQRMGPGGMGVGQQSPPSGMGSQGDFSVVGYSSESAMTSFVAGTCKITDGTMIDLSATEMSCLISDELAEVNELSVGDSFTLTNPNDEDEEIEFTIAGIYHNSESSANTEDMRGFSTASDPANQIYVSYPALRAVADTSTENADTETDEDTGTVSTTALRTQVAGTYVFADVKDYESFQQDAEEMGLSDDYTITSNDVENYENSLIPLENLSKFATYFFWVVLLIGGLILVVFNLFHIRERKYEIGVLTAIGMKKYKVAVQFVLELFMVTFLGVILGTAIGGMISVPTTNQLLVDQVASQQTQQQNVQQNFGRQGADQAETEQDEGIQAPANMENGGMPGEKTNYLSEITSATDMTVVLQLIGIGLLLTLVSSGVSVAFIMRYEPLKILSDRS